MIRPRDIVTVAAEGRQSMAVAFALAERFVLASIRAHFVRESGTGAETANMTVDLQSQRGPSFGTRLATFIGAGTNNDVAASIENCEMPKYTIEFGDKVLISWTSPDADEIRWGIEVGMVPARLVE